ncbi:protein kinase [Vibrio sp. 10N.286.49.B3]|uniref:leucine-rich repeat-containing protein kinase family protein n=1 Tax=Vibrio sp. 10N.286.49.B3 TaxID=1880855 RepID=UPI000C8325D9|nr:leucine-rich repeat-containing protein kinase family protein [Vibrio sp. 10N.286.49.B3]PMH46166.1 protein kinase [Vibrio sp. 10N.286.49.B3]
MHTLAQLLNGQLTGTIHLKLSEQLTELPAEILQLADTLEILDVSNNQLLDLPAFISQLPHLKIVFASNNLFTHLPPVLGQCDQLEMIGFKSNQIKTVAKEALPAKLRWLILTDNQLTSLPDELGHRHRLQKLALAGNQLTHLPETMAQLDKLELIRLSANQLTAFPAQLLRLPKLAWLAFAGNPFCHHSDTQGAIPYVKSDSFVLNQELGRGASGTIYHAHWHNNQYNLPEEVAVKVFKGEVTSDGYPHDELQACLQTGQHKNIVKSIAQVEEGNYRALVMELIPTDFFNLGLPPTFETCTRDTFPADFSLQVTKIENIVEQMFNVFNHFHSNKVCHGDLYAHNVLINKDAEMIFGDFGAASVYEYLNESQQKAIRTIEARAFSHFIDDLLSICVEEDKASASYRHLVNLARLSR